MLTPGIEWPAVQALLARDTATPMGRELALALAPHVDLAAIQTVLARTREARLALGAAGVPPWEVIPDVRPTLHRARMDGSVLDGRELRGLIPLIDAAARLQAYGRTVALVAPGLSADLVSLPALRALGNRLRHALDEEGLVRDEASPALRRLRQRVRDLRHDIVRRLEGYFQGPGAEHAFHERYV
ncbi:MAG TPA: hypothetical protein VML54_08490, partial [Candidatus Limnocylindrales bacterium]|nr:hypothetical protein [Candidatus Limnocylindrales bacterium]